MIAVAGEALMDLLVDASGTVVAAPGGGPFNAARMVARLGGAARFIGRLSDDTLGHRLRAALEEDRVEVVVATPVGLPTTLAVAQLDDAGVPRYRFYLDGTSVPQLSLGEVSPSTVAGIDAMLVGGLGLVAEPMASTLLEAMSWVAPQVVVMLDPNCRPQAITDPAGYRRRLTGYLARTDVVKLSVEDLWFIDPGAHPVDAARRLLAQGPRAVLVTDGGSPVRMLARDVELSADVPRIPVVDTVGAGDAFAAAFLVSWTAASRTREDLADAGALRAATVAAVAVATATCQGRGAHPAGLFVESVARSSASAIGAARQHRQPPDDE